MTIPTEAVLGMMGIAAALAAFAGYRWRQRLRVRGIKLWIREFLSSRYGALPDLLNINCSDDRLWPVQVTFDRRHPATRTSLQFSCGGRPATYALLSEKIEPR
ncbi:MAG: hypothetical protein HY290_18450 [Planctomycetia bacterium]|nr:hypothetical protein [Planctomycetia bacterium]